MQAPLHDAFSRAGSAEGMASRLIRPLRALIALVALAVLAAQFVLDGVKIALG